MATGAVMEPGALIEFASGARLRVIARVIDADILIGRWERGPQDRPEPLYVLWKRFEIDADFVTYALATGRAGVIERAPRPRARRFPITVKYPTKP